MIIASNRKKRRDQNDNKAEAKKSTTRFTRKSKPVIRGGENLIVGTPLSIEISELW
jgi:hypothetical protein